MGKWLSVLLVLGLAACSRTTSPPVAETQNEASLALPAPARSSAPAVQKVDEARYAPAAEARSSPDPTETAVHDEWVIPAGTPLRVRVQEPLNTRRNRAGDAFRATLEAPVMVEGRTAIPAGTRFAGTVITSSSSGRLEGSAVLGVELEGFYWRGKEYRIRTDRVARESAAHARPNAGIGALIGALAGGGKAAADGVGTGKLEVGVPAEAVLTFALQAPVRI